MYSSNKLNAFAKNKGTKLVLALFIILLIGRNSGNHKKETSQLAVLDENYSIQDVLIETRDGAKISAIIVRKKEIKDPKPVILQSTIYVRDKGRDLITLKESADKGYVGIIAYARGKRLSPDEIWPYENVANRPGMGLPMENNIFVNPNYEWAFYVGSNKYLDTVAGDDRQRFREMQNKWWQSGAAYKELDSIDGTPNKWFQRWISHPSFDEY